MPSRIDAPNCQVARPSGAQLISNTFGTPYTPLIRSPGRHWFASTSGTNYQRWSVGALVLPHSRTSPALVRVVISTRSTLPGTGNVGGVEFATPDHAECLRLSTTPRVWATDAAITNPSALWLGRPA